MRVAVIGGTRFVGPVTVGLLIAAGHEVCVAHTGTHEDEAVNSLEHLHGDRKGLLEERGAVEVWGPDVLIDTFPGGATAEKGQQLARCAARIGARVVAVSSMDVYQHCVDAGVADGGGLLQLSIDPIPLNEDARKRQGPYPGGSAAHDNIAMEAALQEEHCPAVVLRPGAIYGPHPTTREWELVRLIAQGQRRLALPAGGVQVFHRVAVERVGRAIVAAAKYEPKEVWPCNVVDPFDWDYSGLAKRIATILDWKWEPQDVAFTATDHPWQVGHPVLGSDRRLRDTLGVQDPDPEDALRETIEWLWENREKLPH